MTTSTVISSTSIIAELKRCGITHVVSVPDYMTASLYELIEKDPDLKMVKVCRENEVVGVYAGLYLGGKKPMAFIQNVGFFNCVDAIVSTAHAYKIPLYMVIGYRGRGNMLRVSGGDYVDAAANATEPVLKSLSIPYYIVEAPEDASIFCKAYQECQSSGKPVAILIGKELPKE